MKHCRPLALAVILISLAPRACAQPAYSVNVVGYVDVTLLPGTNLIANPLNASSNTVGFLFRGLPDGTVFLPWNQSLAAFHPTNRFSTTVGWSDPEFTFVPPGGGFLIVTSTTKLSFHGESWAFATGPFCLDYPANETISGWFPRTFCGFCDPIACPPYSDGTVISTWNAAGQFYNDYMYFGGFGWVPSDPAVGPAEAFRINAPATFFARSPFHGSLGFNGTLVHGRRFGVVRHVERSGANMRFQLEPAPPMEPSASGYSLLAATNLGSTVWRVVAQETNAVADFIVPMTNTLSFYKVHPPYPGWPHLVSRSRAGATFSFDFYAPTSAIYRIERTSQFEPGVTSNWETITNVPAVARTAVTAIDQAATNVTAYYRVSY